MKIKTFIVDAFTDKAFKGNPAGVCLLDEPIESILMQSIANELNLSETAFITKIKDEKFNIRYFTPTTEIGFCGHATLASAKVLITKQNKNHIAFNTFHNLKISAENEGQCIKMNFPLYGTIDYSVPQELYDAFGINDPVGKGWAKELDMLVIEVESKQILEGLQPNFEKAIQSSDEIREVVVTSRSTNKEYDFYSRCFCPWVGINEDPVTGAAHSVLAKYWGDKLNTSCLNAYQVSRRGGHMKLNITSNNTLDVRSNAVITFEGEFELG